MVKLLIKMVQSVWQNVLIMGGIWLIIYLNLMMDLQEQIESYSPQTGSQNNQQNKNSYLQQQPEMPNYLAYSPDDSVEPKPAEDRSTEAETDQEQPSGCTKFCSQKYYEEYFKVSETQVKERVLVTLVPPFTSEFIDLIKPSPDFYGPFWIMTTIVFLLGVVGNFANYVRSKFVNHSNFEGYFFELSLVRYGMVLVYSFGVGVPVVMYFLFKFMKCNTLTFPQIACLYGYSLACYVPALLLCILPLSPLQWIFLLYALVNSSLFLVLSLRKHIEGLKAKFVVVFGILGGMQLVFFLCAKLIFINLLGVTPEEQ